MLRMLIVQTISRKPMKSINTCLVLLTPNNYLIWLISRLATYLPSPVPPPQVQQCEFNEHLKIISSTKAGGANGIPPRLLKEFAYELSQPVTDVVNASLSQGKNFHPNGNMQMSFQSQRTPPPPSIDKLRSILLTPCLVKVAEGKVCKWIMDKIHSGVDARQFGNQKRVSTTQCLIDVYHHLISGAENPAA